MSDLDDDLLALADGDDFSDQEDQVSVSRKRDATELSDSDDDESVPTKKRNKYTEYDEDMEEDEEDDYVPGGSYGNDDEDREEEEEEEEESMESAPYPLEGLYKNEDDREEILSKNEIEREQIVFQRSEEMKTYRERKMLRERAKQIRRDQQRIQSSSNRKGQKSTRSTEAVSAKDIRSSKLNELKKQRAKKRNQVEYGSEDEDNEYGSDDYTPAKTVKSRKGRYDDEEDEEDDYYEEDDEDQYYPGSGDRRGNTTEVEWAEDEYEADRDASIEDFNKLKLGRQFVDKFCFYPEFNKIVQGCYGRVNVGVDKHTGAPTYRMVKIEKVFLQKPYNFGRFFTNQYFGVTQGKDRKVFQMKFFSDGEITPNEYERYMSCLSNQDIQKPSLYDIKDKLSELKAFIEEPMNDKLMDQIVRNRLQFNKKLSGTNAVLEKTVLREKLQYAKDTGNERDVAKYSSQLRSLEKRLNMYEKHHENDQTGAKKLGALTNKNKRINIDKMREASHRIVQHDMKTFDMKSDPFSRLKTRTKVYYQEVQEAENAKAKEEARQKLLQENKDAAAHKEKTLLLAKFRRLGGLEELVPTIDIKFNV
ncbi:hypothetical protein ACO0RG_000393 [Hanseniaspora osmophila]|uniref:RNA polymerase-associated protein RTF1 n=1 Tax=Hanseniaspora osmophila TaxID=56408 RepID=A0A1E5R1X0_9ASCO|nr:RNA polymerase-associated protein RTF1 [Hanseniaspora osmophila]